jgi:hypothetical protein
MHEDRRAELLGGGEERLEAGLADRHAVDVARDFNPREFQRFA